MPSTDVAPATAPAAGVVLGREQHLQAALEASHVWVQVAGLEDSELEHIEREVRSQRCASHAHHETLRFMRVWCHLG
jgi:hypothetical protein